MPDGLVTTVGANHLEVVDDTALCADEFPYLIFGADGALPQHGARWGVGVERVQLLTNNPEKVRAIEEAGICVVDRKPLHGRLNRHNQRYVHAKVHRAGHWLLDMIDESLLTAPEKDWLNRYHADVRAAIAPQVDADTKQWLEQATRAI